MSRVTSGCRLIVGNFQLQPGREISGVLDEEGRVYRPHPYDIPRDPHKLSLFSVHLLEAMIDSGLITDEYFSGREGDVLDFHSHLMHLRNNMGRCSGVPMRCQS